MTGVEWMIRQVRLYGQYKIGQYVILTHRGNKPNHYDVWMNYHRVFSGTASDTYWYCVSQTKEGNAV